MCKHTGTVINQGTSCADCQWDATVGSTKVGTTCNFTYTVVRSNCTLCRDQTFTGTSSVPCSQSLDLSFPCDPQSNDIGYRLILEACDCPDGPGGTAGTGGQHSSKLT